METRPRFVCRASYRQEVNCVKTRLIFIIIYNVLDFAVVPVKYHLDASLSKILQWSRCSARKTVLCESVVTHAGLHRLKDFRV